MTALSVNLLDSSRIEAGRLTLQKIPAELGEVVEQSIALARPTATLKKIDLRFDRAVELPPIEIDPIQMSRVVSNLLDNAIEHTPAGGSIRMCLEQRAPDVRFSISDDGPGIPPERLARIFEQYHESTKTGSEGSGLGLFIVKAIVDAHGGRLDVHTGVGAGTTFTIDLPGTAKT
jgi:signal transduction histidine kinase